MARNLKKLRAHLKGHISHPRKAGYSVSSGVLQKHTARYAAQDVAQRKPQRNRENLPTNMEISTFFASLREQPRNLWWISDAEENVDLAVLDYEIDAINTEIQRLVKEQERINVLRALASLHPLEPSAEESTALKIVADVRPHEAASRPHMKQVVMETVDVCESDTESEVSDTELAAVRSVKARGGAAGTSAAGAARRRSVGATGHGIPSASRSWTREVVASTGPEAVAGLQEGGAGLGVSEADEEVFGDHVMGALIDVPALEPDCRRPVGVAGADRDAVGAEPTMGGLDAESEFGDLTLELGGPAGDGGPYGYADELTTLLGSVTPTMGGVFGWDAIGPDSSPALPLSGKPSRTGAKARTPRPRPRSRPAASRQGAGAGLGPEPAIKRKRLDALCAEFASAAAPEDQSSSIVPSAAGACADAIGDANHVALLAGSPARPKPASRPRRPKAPARPQFTGCPPSGGDGGAGPSAAGTSTLSVEEGQALAHQIGQLPAASVPGLLQIVAPYVRDRLPASSDLEFDFSTLEPDVAARVVAYVRQHARKRAPRKPRARPAPAAVQCASVPAVAPDGYLLSDLASTSTVLWPDSASPTAPPFTLPLLPDQEMCAPDANGGGLWMPGAKRRQRKAPLSTAPRTDLQEAIDPLLSGVPEVALTECGEGEAALAVGGGALDDGDFMMETPEDLATAAAEADALLGDG